MSDVRFVDIDTLDALVWGSKGESHGGLVRVQDNLTKSTRWSLLYELIFFDSGDETYWKVIREEPATEMQEGMEPWGFDDPVKCTRVYPKTIEITTYQDDPDV